MTEGTAGAAGSQGSAGSPQNTSTTNNTNTNTTTTNTTNTSTGDFQLTADDTSYMDSLVSNRGYDKAHLDSLVKDPNGYKLFTTMREQHRLLGQFQGGNNIVLPKDANDTAAMNAIYDKLGRPKAPTDYKIEVPQGGDSGFALEAAKWFHETGLNQNQVSTLSTKWEGYMQNLIKQSEADDAAKAVQDIDAVEKEWGANAKVNGELATRGLNLTAKELGWDANKVEAIKNGHNVTLSAGEALKLWKAMGEIGKTTGDTFEGSGPGSRSNSGSITPQAAKDRISALMQDKAFYGRLQAKDANAQKEWDDLHKIAAQAA